MSITNNIDKLLDGSFENHNYLPQKLMLEDLDQGIVDYIKGLNVSVEAEDGTRKTVPIIFLSQELWAEQRLNWKNYRNEDGQELTRPFMTVSRVSVKRGESPLKRTIPVKKKFKFLKVPKFDGTVKGYDLYKIPQPSYVDCDYELRFLSHYFLDVNEIYDSILSEGYSDGQGYMKINGYYISSVLGDPSEDNSTDDVSEERVFQIIFPITVHGKLVDPTQFEKVPTVNRISINISEKKR